MDNKLFRNARVLQFSGQGLGAKASVVNADVGIEGNRIAFVGKAPDDFAATTIDATNCVLMPGLVNAHTHLPMTLFRNAADDMPLLQWLEKRIWPMEEGLTAEDAYWGAMLALCEMVRGGVTAINDMYFFTDAFAPAAAKSGIRALLSRAIVTYSGSDDKYFAQARALHEAWNGAANGRIRVALAPHAEYTCDVPTLERIAKVAGELDSPIHTHVSESRQEHEDCLKRHGVTPTALMHKCGLLGKRTLLAHGVYLSDDDIRLIAEAGSHVLHNPQSNLKLGSGVAPIPAMMRGGVNVALGTDGAASNNNLDMWEELRLSATLHKGVLCDATAIPAAVALEMATAGGARALGMGCANIEAGQAADICMVSLNAPHMRPANDIVAALAYCAGTSDVALTMIDGEIVYANGQYYTLDTEQIFAEAERIAARLCV